MGANFGQLRKSPYYGEALAWLKGNTSLGSTLAAMGGTGTTDPIDDLQTAVIGFPTVEMDANRAAEAPFVAVV